jgi:gliding motility-associated lipoprotein GldH
MVPLDNSNWVQQEPIDITFDITDPTATYSLYYTLRYTVDYPYYNIWLNRSILNSKQQMISKKLQGLDLFNGKSGEPMGGGFGNSFDIEILSDSTLRFPTAGTHTLRIQQYMRQDTLKGIEAVGIKLKQNL